MRAGPIRGSMAKPRKPWSVSHLVPGYVVCGFQDRRYREACLGFARRPWECRPKVSRPSDDSSGFWTALRLGLITALSRGAGAKAHWL
jgi:hypothetical protein